MLNNEIRDGVEVVRKYGDVPRITCYPDELNQVGTNLVMNAVQVMGGKGTLTIETGTEDGHLYVRVSDTGPGIPDELRDRIFEPFFTTKDQGQGSGLGLHICRQFVVDKHGGRLELESGIDLTTFTVRLPTIA